MKKQIRFLGMLFLITCLFGMLSVSYAEQFDTNIVSRDVKPGGSSTEDLYKYWAYYKNTGTRYVFRVYDWNSKQYIAVPKEYYINHVYGYTSSGKVDTTKQIMYLGVDKTENGKYNVVKSGSSIFTDNTYSHILTWFDNSNVTNFGVTKNDAKILAEIIRDAAISNGNSVLAKNMQNVIEGKVPYDIRAEILFLMKIPGTEGTRETATVYGKGSMEEYSFTFYKNNAKKKDPSSMWRKEYITYLEAKAICKSFEDDCGFTMKKDWLDGIACALYEKDEEYVFVNNIYQCSCDYYKIKFGNDIYSLSGNKICLSKPRENPSRKSDRWYMYYTPGRCGIPISISGKTYYLTPGQTYPNVNGKTLSVTKDIKYSDSKKGHTTLNADDVKYVTNDASRATIYEGWDYITNKMSAILVIGCDKDTGKIITANNVTYSEFGHVGAGTYNKKAWNIEGYEYVGNITRNDFSSPSTPIKVSDTSDSTNVKITKNDIENGVKKQVIFVYEKKQAKTTVKIWYKNEKTGDVITGIEPNPVGPNDRNSDGKYYYKDLTSNGYTYIGVQVDESSIDSTTDNATIPDDKKLHEITFWYKPEEITRIKITHKSESNKILSGPIEFTIKNGESAKTFSQQATAFGSNYEYTGLEKISPEKETKDPSKTSITIGFDGDKTYEIIFWYKMQTHIKIIGKCEGRAGFIYTKDLGKANLPLKGTYKESSYTPNNYTYLNEYEVKYGTHTYMGKGTTTSGSSVSLDIAESNDAPNQILIVFYYKSNYSATVEHYYVDPTGANSDELKEKYDINIIPGVSKELPSIRMVNKEGTPCINLKYDGLNVTPNNFKQYTRDAYTLTLTPDESNYIIRFYYTSQIIKIRHEKENGKLIEEEEKILNPNEEENPLKDYTFKESKLNDDDPTKDTPVKVPVKEGVPSQELVFIYKDPELIFGPDDPNPEPNPEDYNKKRNEYNTGIIPNDLNNQLIGQDAEKYYWVLNENGEITVRLAVGHMDTGTHSLTCTLKIPFDVYINKIYNKANTECTVKCDYKETKDGYDIYEGNIKDIYVPVWVEEKEYEITGKVNYVYTSADGKAANPINSTATAEVTVVGAVYDFTITNLDGSDTTGDSMWKKSLFPTVKQVEEGYKAAATAIGQGTQQPSKYYQAIKRGTRFYFSVNTLGAANNQIEIVPSFYYVSANGQSLEKVTMKSNYMNSTRSINLNDTNRVTTEFSKERAMKNTLDNGATSKAGTVFEVGNYRKLTLNRNVNTPYLGIVNDVKARFAGKELTAILQGTAKTDKDLYKVANHWYADYSVPNDATFYKADGTQVDENGCLVVYFSIITKNNANNEYLAYNLESPFVQSEKISEWNYERKDNTLTKVADYRLVLPKTSVNNASKNITTNDIWIKGTNKAGHTAVIIYSLKQNVSTRQNVTSAGTH